MKRPRSRRNFLRTNLGLAIAAGVAPRLVESKLFGQTGTAPSKRLTIASIGVGPQGRGLLGGFLAQTDTRVVALCDVAQQNLKPALDQVNQHYQDKSCATYSDFRELLSRKDLDAVVVATPDHWHVPIAIAAANAGKDVYLEKPMGLTVAENQLLRKTLQKNERVFQFGTQQRSSNAFRRACELVRNGRIGQLKSIQVWCSASRPGGSISPAPVPEGLDYSRWLGPAPDKPFTADRCFDDSGPGTWKTRWFDNDFALGFIAGWGIHPLDIALWGYPGMLKGNFDIEGKAIFPSGGACNTAVAWDVHFTFPGGVSMQYRGTRNGFDTVCPMNDLRPLEARYGPIQGHGTAFEGSNGWVLVDRSGLRTHPEDLPDAGENETRLIRSSNHIRNFLEAIRTRRQTICPIEESVKADNLCHLSNIATRLERKLKWDPAAERFVGDDEANRRLALRPMRAPWGI